MLPRVYADLPELRARWSNSQLDIAGVFAVRRSKSALPRFVLNNISRVGSAASAGIRYVPAASNLPLSDGPRPVNKVIGRALYRKRR
jgi:hypothetical protein